MVKAFIIVGIIVILTLIELARGPRFYGTPTTKDESASGRRRRPRRNS